MKNSYILRVSRGRVVFPSDIRNQFALEPDSTLYAVAAPDNDAPYSYIMSTIPLQYWRNSFRLQVYVASPPGSLETVAGVLAKHGINVLDAWTAAISSNGEGCLTSTVQICGDDIAGKRLLDLEHAIRSELEDKKVLSDSNLFKGPDPLSRVRLTKLLVLAKLGELYSSGAVYKLQLEGSSLNLKVAGDDSGRPHSLIDYEDRSFPGYGDQILISPDTEERILDSTSLLIILVSVVVERMRYGRGWKKS